MLSQVFLPKAGRKRTKKSATSRGSSGPYTLDWTPASDHFPMAWSRLKPLVGGFIWACVCLHRRPTHTVLLIVIRLTLDWAISKRGLEGVTWRNTTLEKTCAFHLGGEVGMKEKIPVSQSSQYLFAHGCNYHQPSSSQRLVDPSPAFNHSRFRLSSHAWLVARLRHLPQMAASVQDSQSASSPAS